MALFVSAALSLSAQSEPSAPPAPPAVAAAPTTLHLAVVSSADLSALELTADRGTVAPSPVGGVPPPRTLEGTPPPRTPPSPSPHRVEFLVTAKSPSGATASAASASAADALVTLRTPAWAFTVRAGDVTTEFPVFLPADGVAVTLASDPRAYAQIAAATRARGTMTKLQRYEREPEENFPAAAAHTREQKVQTWLGLSRDMRIFRIDPRATSIQPTRSGFDLKLPETSDHQPIYLFNVGRGWGPADHITRRLDDGDLPILHAETVDDALIYNVTLFASYEKSPFDAAHLRGTHYLVADAYSHGHMFTPEQSAELEKLRPTELDQPEETVLYARVVATNRGATPAYALFKSVSPTLPPVMKPPAWTFDRATGFGVFPTGRVFAVSRTADGPLDLPEKSVLLPPGASVTFDFFVPHSPISAERAAALATQSFDARLAEARAFWRGQLAFAARVHLPEPRMDEMMRAGLLHLDLINYGLEPHGTLAPTIGIYSPIGSESAPIIQFMDSMGWHETARRAIDYFLDKQHADGFIQNFNGYMLETGAALWTIGEHYRYTHDDTWARAVAPKVIKSCEFLAAWRARNRTEALRGRGYGLLEGKVADPDDPFHSFMLSGYACLGLARAAEMLAAIDPAASARWRAEADGLRADLRTALAESMARSPVVPLGDGTWSRTAPPWTEARGLMMLHIDGEPVFTHGTMTARDSLLGPLYLAFQEVLAPGEPATTALLHVNSELMLADNVAFSQPYYSRHPWVHLHRGEVKPFLKAYYNAVAALADRSTYTFTEHFFPASDHKTHEEAWFLMQTRWMLYFEDGDTLHLLATVPRDYLADGKTISVENVSSYFGPLSFRVDSDLAHGVIRAHVTCAGPRHPRTVEFRLPHPTGARATSVEGGIYDAARELVRLENFTGEADVVLRFPTK